MATSSRSLGRRSGLPSAPSHLAHRRQVARIRRPRRRRSPVRRTNRAFPALPHPSASGPGSLPVVPYISDGKGLLPLLSRLAGRKTRCGVDQSPAPVQEHPGAENTACAQAGSNPVTRYSGYPMGVIVSLGTIQPVILVGMSGSSASRAALRWAAREARLQSARLRVIQAHQPYAALAPYAIAKADQPLPAARAARRLAAEIREVLGPLQASETETELIDGTAERVLVNASADADLLVLGSGGQPPSAQPGDLLAERPIGPVIRACLNHAHCPVVVIGPALLTPAPSGRAAPTTKRTGSARNRRVSALTGYSR